MFRTRIKICGITSPSDALAAVAAGADAIGLVFHEPSSRAITIEQAAAIADVVPPFVSITGLFVNASAQRVEQVCQQVPISLLQFHGDEDHAYCEFFQRPYIKAIPVAQDTEVAVRAAEFPGASGILLDTWQADRAGGTGKRFNWSLVPLDRRWPLLLAGGLAAENVGQAMAATRPHAVDVSSGVEASPGVKDHRRIKEFAAAVYAADKKLSE